MACCASKRQPHLRRLLALCFLLRHRRRHRWCEPVPWQTLFARRSCRAHLRCAIRALKGSLCVACATTCCACGEGVSSLDLLRASRQSANRRAAGLPVLATMVGTIARCQNVPMRHAAPFCTAHADQRWCPLSIRCMIWHVAWCRRRLQPLRFRRPRLRHRPRQNLHLRQQHHRRRTAGCKIQVLSIACAMRNSPLMRIATL